MRFCFACAVLAFCLYGTASKMPASFVEESAKVFLDVMTMAAEEESASAAA